MTVYPHPYTIKITQKIEKTPEEYLPALLEMIRLFRETVTLKPADESFMPGWKETLSHLPLVLVMDGSQAGRGCTVLMVGVLYQKRTLPIARLVYKGKKGHASAERHIQALEKVALPFLAGKPETSAADLSKELVTPRQAAAVREIRG